MADPIPRLLDPLPREPKKLPIKPKVYGTPRKKRFPGAALAGAIGLISPSLVHATMPEVYTPGFVDYLKDVEGYGAGYRKTTKRYYPYNDPMGHPTIGIGHLIKKGEIGKFAKGITDDQVHDLLRDDVEEHMNRAWDYVDSHFEVGTWKKLSPRQKQILTEYAFHLGGLGRYSNFTKAIVEKDWERAYGEMRRYAYKRNSRGETTTILPLQRRDRIFYDNFLKDLREKQTAERGALAETLARRASEL